MLQTLAVRRELREESAVQSGKEGQRGEEGDARKGRRRDDTFDLLYLRMF